MTRELPERVAARIFYDPGGCWLWMGALNNTGYGTISSQGFRAGAHRWVYTWLVGEIPEGHDIDHLCKVRDCVNPDHLEPVTHRENLLRGNTFAARLAKKTECERHPGKPLDVRSDNGRRKCKDCDAQRAREKRARDRAN